MTDLRELKVQFEAPGDADWVSALAADSEENAITLYVISNGLYAEHLPHWYPTLLAARYAGVAPWVLTGETYREALDKWHRRLKVAVAAEQNIERSREAERATASAAQEEVRVRIHPDDIHAFARIVPLVIYDELRGSLFRFADRARRALGQRGVR